MLCFKKRNEKILKCFLILTTLFCFVLLLPQVRNFIIEILEKVLGRELNHNIWMEAQLEFYSLLAICFLVFSFVFILRKTPVLKNMGNYINKYGKTIFIFAAVGISVLSVIVRIIMYVKCCSIWLDEAMLASSIVSRNLPELLSPPLLDNQSAPVLYVIAVKFICLIFGYSEFSLRIFSFVSFLGFLVCEILLLKKAFSFDNFKIAVVATITTLLPHYIWYSNEFKPYMGDAFFVILAFLIYTFYTQGKIKLPILTALYILSLGFSSPVIFFIGGILLNEFLTAIFNKNRKQIFYIAISGTVVLIVFGLYYHWWLSPVKNFMQIYWGKPYIWQLPNIFREGPSDSSFIWLFTPFAFLGMFSLIKSGNKIASSAALSLFFVFLASLLGYWPLVSRLWLFLPAIILIFSPCGFDFIRHKKEDKSAVDIVEYLLISIMIIFLSVNCLKYTGDKMYFHGDVNPLISYVNENIKENEKLYVSPFMKRVFEFKNGYNKTKIGNMTNDNIIYGKESHDWGKNFVENELQLILENQKTYLLFHLFLFENDKALSVLRNYGTLTEIVNVHDTPLYYFELDESKEKEY